RGATPSLHRERRGAPLARRDDREYREYLREEQRSQRGCIAVRMQMELHHGLLGQSSRWAWRAKLKVTSPSCKSPLGDRANSRRRRVGTRIAPSATGG